MPATLPPGWAALGPAGRAPFLMGMMGMMWVPLLLGVSFRERGPHLSATLLFQLVILPIKQGLIILHRIECKSSLKQMPWIRSIGRLS